MDFPHLSLRVDGRNGFDPSRPIRSGLATAAVGLLPLALGLADVIRPLSGLVFAGIFAVVGALQWSLALFELTDLRRRADLELRREPRPHLLSTLAQWRARELTSDRYRLALTRSVARTVRDLSPMLLPGASPINRVAARPHAELFNHLAERLAALDRPVTPQAILEVEDLLTSPDSPLYARGRAAELRTSLLTSLHGLDALTVSFPAARDPARRQSGLTAGRNGQRLLAGKTSGLRRVLLEPVSTLFGRRAMAARRNQD
ncbi:MAG: hypothetical protein ACTHNB_05800 [Gaiellaceae bacterium]